MAVWPLSCKDYGCVTHIQYFRIRPRDTITVLGKCDRRIKILIATIYRWVQCMIRVIRDLDILHMRIWSKVLVHWTLRTVRSLQVAQIDWKNLALPSVYDRALNQFPYTTSRTVVLYTLTIYKVALEAFAE